MPLFSFTGKRSPNLGVDSHGNLAPCPSTPNCVSSQAPKTDKTHSVPPLPYPSGVNTPKDAIAKIKKIVTGTKNTKIIQETENYLYAEFKTALFGFVDDVEFLAKEGEKVVHVRSASRLGRSDLGKNKKRIDTIRRKFARK